MKIWILSFIGINQWAKPAFSSYLIKLLYNQSIYALRLHYFFVKSYPKTIQPCELQLLDF
jgi:hypothetical protein